MITEGITLRASGISKVLSYIIVYSLPTVASTQVFIVCQLSRSDLRLI